MARSKLRQPGSLDCTDWKSSCFVEYNLCFWAAGSCYIGWGQGVLRPWISDSIFLLWIREEVVLRLFTQQKSFPKQDTNYDDITHFGMCNRLCLVKFLSNKDYITTISRICHRVRGCTTTCISSLDPLILHEFSVFQQSYCSWLQKMKGIWKISFTKKSNEKANITFWICIWIQICLKLFI